MGWWWDDDRDGDDVRGRLIIMDFFFVNMKNVNVKLAKLALSMKLVSCICMRRKGGAEVDGAPKLRYLSTQRRPHFARVLATRVRYLPTSVLLTVEDTSCTG